jgi:3',5'-cyclic AMP phosphodiesterase CpdA
MEPQKYVSRRQMLRMSAGSLLAAGLWPGTIWSDAGNGGDEFWFLVVNDLHYHDPRCGPWFEKMVRQMNESAVRSQGSGVRGQEPEQRPERIEFCLVVGDLVEDGTGEQFGPLREILQTLKFPYRAVVGNHDYRRGDDRKVFEELFPKSLNYHFEHSGWQFIGLDSSEGRKPIAAVQPPTFRWLDDTLPKLDRRRPTVVFTHFPLGPWVVYRATNADQLLERFKEFNLVAIYNGHFHSLTQRRRGRTIITTNRCCSFFKHNHDGTKEKGYFLCRAKDGKIERKFVELKG